MKKLMLLAVTILFNFNSFSQKIILSDKQAKAVAVDLVNGKACAEERELTNAQVKLLENKISVKDRVIVNLETQKKVFQEKDLVREQQIQVQKETISELTTIITKTENKTLFWKITTLAAVIGGGALLIVK